MERDTGTAQNRWKAIGYFNKIRFGANLMREMTRLQNLMKGARRERGPHKRKLPVSVEDSARIYKKADWDSPDSVAIWGEIPIVWFFILRMGEYLEKPTEKRPEQGQYPAPPITCERNRSLDKWDHG